VADPFSYKAEHESLKESLLKEWIRKRVETIHHHLDAASVLEANGVRLRYGGAQPEQISCPFHGVDRKPSARYHPASGNSVAGVWCFVCNERWDAIALWGKFAQYEGPFSGLLRRIEAELHLDTPDVPSGLSETVVRPPDTRLREQLEAVDSRLRSSKKELDLSTYLTLGSALDYLWTLEKQGLMDFDKAQPLVQKVLAKIRCRGD
jgi:hypothetical protein